MPKTRKGYNTGIPHGNGEDTGIPASQRENGTGPDVGTMSNEALGLPSGTPWGSPNRMRAEREARGEPLVRDPGDPSGVEAWRRWKASKEVGAVTIAPGGHTREGLRASLQALEAAYGRAQAAQDWGECSRINTAREPLFKELWELEKGLPQTERFWFPVRFQA